MSTPRIRALTGARKLPPPLFDWDPFFTDLPVEVLEQVFSHFAFQVRIKSQKADPLYLYQYGKLRTKQDFHPFNALALASKALNRAVEGYCDHLIKIYCDRDKCECESFRLQDTSAHKKGYWGKNHCRWLVHTAHSCAFCGRNSVESVVEPSDADERQDTAYVAVAENRTRTPLYLISPRFQPLILSCHDCEQRVWHDQISVEDAVNKYGLPEYFVYFPPRQLHFGRDNFEPVKHSEFRWCRLRMHPAQEFCERCKPRRWKQQRPMDYVLGHEMEEVREIVLSDPHRWVPNWMVKYPPCFDTPTLDDAQLAKTRSISRRSESSQSTFDIFDCTCAMEDELAGHCPVDHEAWDVLPAGLTGRNSPGSSEVRNVYS